MKCPECGFVSFPGLNRCKKCGHRFTDLREESQEIGSLFYTPRSAANASSKPTSETNLDGTEMAGHGAGELDIELKPEGAASGATKPKEDRPAQPPPESQVAVDWQAELAERVHEYRQRRARLHNSKEDNPDNLDLDFGPSAPGQPEPRPNIIEFPTSEELERPAKPATEVRSAPKRKALESFEPAFPRGGGKINPPLSSILPSTPDTGPLEIEFGSSQGNSAAGIRAGESSGVPGARMSARFFAGIIDGLVLLCGAAAYSLIFWRIAGGMSFQPLELVVGGVISVFFILLYFAGCMALASATPGLMWTGLEVITFEGNAPTLSDCLWRGFGYLVSMSALMLGFVWATVDPDGLTWHDRMSRTFVVPADH